MKIEKCLFPKNYEDCYDDLNREMTVIFVDKKEDYLYTDFVQLIRCRNTYWEIIGKEMGLDKPWKPNYETLVDNEYFTIHTFNNEIVKSGTSHRNAILAFPTEEIRDIFYENFKDFIENCKELL